MQLQQASVGCSMSAAPATTTVQGFELCSLTVTAEPALGTDSSKMKSDQFWSKRAVEQSAATSTANPTRVVGVLAPATTRRG